MAAPKSSVWHPRRGTWYGMALMLVLAAAPHLWRLHPLASLGWLAIVGWRLYLGLHQRHPPGLVARLGLLAGSAIPLLTQFGTLVGRDAGSALLVIMLALKFLELRSRRDAALLVYLGYFLLAVQLLFSQQIPMAVYLVATALVITTVWVDLSDPLGGRPLRHSLKLAGSLLGQAAPLMLILFVLFPRIPGPLWNLPRDAHSGMTGLGNDMEPGRISQLVRSEAIAFRVSFQDAAPPPQQRYWRGPVFEVTNGRRWVPAPRPASGPEPAPAFTPTPRGPGITHTVTLEPHGQRSLLALDRPGHAVADARLQADFQLVANTDVTQRRRYTVTSYAAMAGSAADPDSMQRSLQVPAMTSERVRALAAGWRQAAATPREIVDQALQFFNREAFVYTLSPPRLPGDPVDEFLFETRRGFCEHYAAAFVILMRAAGVPARVVTGYLGGEFNDIGNYLLVRQSDAHAWAEVWLPEQGWLRVDPTAAIAPQRIERAIDIAPVREGAPVQFRLASDDRLRTLGRRLGQAWDAANNGWNQFVLGYGPDLQQDFLSSLGLPDVSWRGLAAALGMCAAIAVALNLLWVLRRQRPHHDPLQRSYARLTRKLARRGIDYRPAEGPLALAERAAARLDAADARQVRAIVHEYVRLRYAPAGHAASPARLRKLVDALA